MRSLVLVFLVVACDSTKPIDPASVSRVVITPTHVGIVKGSTATLALSAQDSGGNELPVGATWESSTPSVATVSKSGVVTAVSFGTAFISATVGTHRDAAWIVVTDVPIPRSYSVLDLGASQLAERINRLLSDSGDVLSVSPAVLYRNGAPVPLTGCPYPVTLNGPGHVLCMLARTNSVSSYALWRNGTLTPLAAADTFRAQSFGALAMNDSDEVAGLFYLPSFVNVACTPSSSRCLSIWKSGVVTFPGVSVTKDVTLMNTRRQVVIDYPLAFADCCLTASIVDLATGTYRDTPRGELSLNDNGWAAITFNYVAHGAPSRMGATAKVLTPEAIIDLGEGAATGINDSNVAVGTLRIGPFIWRGLGVSLLTNASVEPSWTITGADEINNRGQILATADNSDGRKGHTVLLTPAQP